MPDGFSGPRPPSRFNMAEYCLATAAKQTPDKAGLVVLNGDGPDTVNETWTHCELEHAVLAVANALKEKGISPGNRILIRLGNTIDYALLFFGALALGAVPIPTSSMLTDREADVIMKDADVQAVVQELQEPRSEEATHTATAVHQFSHLDIVEMRHSTPLANYANTDADDPAFLIYTSGTTGKPKGVLHAHRSAWGRRPMYRDWYGINADDRILHAGAFNWTYTLGTGLTDPWANGATAIINTQPRDPSRWPGLIRETNATIFAAVPTLYRQILKYSPPGAIDLGELRHGLTSGETLPASVASEWRDRTGTRLHEAIGMSEMSTYISASPTNPAKPGTIGRAQSGRCIAILSPEGGTVPLANGEIGLLAVHRTDPGLMIDYWHRPDETEKVFRGNWFIGGDLASIDDEGFLTHHGRADDLMNALGYRVSPLEVEQALLTTTGVNEIAVTDIAVRENVRIIVAFVVCGTGGSDMLRNLKATANASLADYKRPRDYTFVNSLPRTANGKIRRSDLQAIYDTMKASS